MDSAVQAIIAALTSTACSASIFWLLFKHSAQKTIDSAIDHSFAKKLARFNSSLTRSERAHSMLIEKEFNYYAIIGPIISSMITDVQDLESAVENDRGEGVTAFTKECSLRMLESTMKLKGMHYEYQSFIPMRVFEASGTVIQTAQKNQQFWCEQIIRISEMTSTTTQEDIDAAISKSNETLLSISYLQTVIATRLKELSASE